MDDLWTNLFSDYDRVSRKELKRLALDSDFNDGRIDALEAERMRLTERVNRSELLIHAMWELLKVRTGATDEELRVMVARIDLADGREDGKIGTKVPSAQCANCGRPINTRRRNCIYCDAPMSEAYKVSQPKKVVRTVTCTRCSASVLLIPVTLTARMSPFTSATLTDSSRGKSLKISITDR